MSAFSAGRTLLNELNPQRVAGGILAFQEVEKRKNQQEMFQRLQEQHSVDLRTDPEYRKNFNAAMKRDPNALMSLKNLSHARGLVGVMRENVTVADQLKQRIAQFAASPQGKQLGFNPEYLTSTLEAIKGRIRSNPEAGSQELFQMSSMIARTMSSMDQEARVGQIEAEIARSTPLQERVQAIIQRQDLSDSQKNSLIKRTLADVNLRGKLASPAGKVNPFGPAAKRVRTQEDLDNLKANVAAAEEQELIPSDVAKDAIVQAEAAKKAVDEGVKQAREVDEGIARFDALTAVFGEDMSRETLLQEFADDPEDFNDKVKNAGVKDVGQFVSQLQDFNSALSRRFRETTDVLAANEQLRQEFQREGGLLSHTDKTPILRNVRTESIVEPSPDLRGSLTIIDEGTGERSTVPLYEDFTPQPNGEDVGLMGVSKMRLSETISTSPQNAGQIIGMAPSFDAIGTDVTDEGDQLQFQFSNFSAKPIMLVSPRAGNVNAGSLQNKIVPDGQGGLSRQSVRKLDLDKYAESIAVHAKLKTTFESLETQRSAVAATLAETQNKDVKQGLREVIRNLDAVNRAVTFTKEGQDIVNTFTGKITKQTTRSLNVKDERSPEAFNDKKLLISRMLIEQARANAVLTNAFISNTGSLTPEETQQVEQVGGAVGEFANPTRLLLKAAEALQSGQQNGTP